MAEAPIKTTTRILGGNQRHSKIRPIRAENRATLVTSIARGRRWLDELIANPTTNPESIAEREGCTARQVNMTISLAFLAPDLVKAAIEGDCHMAWESRLRDFPRNGVAKEKCSALARFCRSPVFCGQTGN